MKRKAGRSCSIRRRTRETDISLTIDLDGSGRSKVKVPDEFLRHMIETLSKYSGFDITLSAKGDIEHHLIEDVAITLGRGLREAIGDKPIRRIADAIIPMDEALVMASLDLIDRPYVDVDIPDIMFEHFFRSFAMEARATIHSQVIRGEDAHHIIEATFKAIGACLREATRLREDLLSTKSKVEWETV
jgi:imidazoleglycerol-phosphate dehydratase